MIWSVIDFTAWVHFFSLMQDLIFKVNESECLDNQSRIRISHYNIIQSNYETHIIGKKIKNECIIYSLLND